jgi:hypothetical protein
MEQDQLQDTSDITMRHQNKPPTPSRKDSEVPTVIHDREEKMAANYDGNWGSRTPEDRMSGGNIYKL